MNLRFLFLIFLQAHASTVIVIGGGPTGLGSAIEARLAGADVFLVEKRSHYTRLNTMSLSAATLQIFEQWKASIPLLQDLEFGNVRRGFILLKDLEDGLSTLATELGVQRVHGEFIDFAENHQALVKTEIGPMILPFDILVGADGAHSRVREKLGIHCILLNETLGGITMVPDTNAAGKLSVEFQPHEDLFVKKVNVPNATVYFFQNRPNQLNRLSLNDMTFFASEVGWNIKEENSIALENIRIPLQRSSTFSEPNKGVILLGDAASAASFFTGTGVNFSFKTTQIAKELFHSDLSEDAYARFNQDMAKEVESFIETNLPFF